MTLFYEKSFSVETLFLLFQNFKISTHMTDKKATDNANSTWRIEINSKSNIPLTGGKVMESANTKSDDSNIMGINRLG